MMQNANSEPSPERAFALPSLAATTLPRLPHNSAGTRTAAFDFMARGPRKRSLKGRRFYNSWSRRSLNELIRRRLAADEDVGKSDRPRFYTRQPWTGQGPTDTAANHDTYLYGP